MIKPKFKIGQWANAEVATGIIGPNEIKRIKTITDENGTKIYYTMMCGHINRLDTFTEEHLLKHNEV